MKHPKWLLFALIFSISCSGPQSSRPSPAAWPPSGGVALETGDGAPSLDAQLQRLAEQYGVSQEQVFEAMLPSAPLEMKSNLQKALGDQDVGEYLTTRSDQEIGALLSKLDISYTVDSDLDLKPLQNLITDCPQRFSPTLAGYRRVGNQTVLIDYKGRPLEAYIRLPIPANVPTFKRNQCQTDVGLWGRQEDPSQTYQGGHLIGFNLGGWNQRANLAPQEANLNTGIWREGERRVRQCRIPGTYNVGVWYSDMLTAGPGKLVPTHFGAWVKRKGDRGGYTNARARTLYTNTPRGAPGSFNDLNYQIYLAQLSLPSAC